MWFSGFIPGRRGFEQKTPFRGNSHRFLSWPLQDTSQLTCDYNSGKLWKTNGAPWFISIFWLKIDPFICSLGATCRRICSKFMCAITTCVSTLGKLTTINTRHSLATVSSSHRVFQVPYTLPKGPHLSTQETHLTSKGFANCLCIRVPFFKQSFPPCFSLYWIKTCQCDSSWENLKDEAVQKLPEWQR